ncbi:PaaI family thioesterase [Sulfurimonas sp.]
MKEISENITALTQKYLDAMHKSAEELQLPAPSFEIMKCEIVEFNEVNKSICVKIPMQEIWLNPYGTMQGGLIMGAIDNAVGPLSLVVASRNMTRDIRSKLLKPIVMEMEYIYVFAKLSEHKKRRLIFESNITNKEGDLLATATLTNWII